MNKNTLILHTAILLLSAPALFAKGIDIPAGMLVWWRCFIGAIVALGVLTITKKLTVSKTSIKWLIITGAFMGIHWWTYFVSIQLSTVAIGILSLFTYPIITTILEPFFFGTKLSKKQLIGGFGIITGVFFLIPEFTTTNNITLGILMGILSASVFSLRNILTKKYLSKVSAISTMGYHIIVAACVLTISLAIKQEPIVIPTFDQGVLIFILATVFTYGSHGLLVYSLKFYSAATLGIVGSLQVVYGPLLAAMYFSEIPDVNFYIGAVIITGIAIYEMLPSKTK